MYFYCPLRFLIVVTSEALQRFLLVFWDAYCQAEFWDHVTIGTCMWKSYLVQPNLDIARLPRWELSLRRIVEELAARLRSILCCGILVNLSGVRAPHGF